MFDFDTTKKFCFKPTQISCSDILIYRKLSNAKHLYGLTFGNGKPFHHKFSGHFQFETWENTGIIFTTGFCVFIDITHPFHLLRAKMTQKMMIEIPGLRDNKYYIHIVSRCKVLRYHLKKYSLWFICLSIYLTKFTFLVVSVRKVCFHFRCNSISLFQF